MLFFYFQLYGKTTKNVRKHRDIKLVITKRRRNYLASKPNYHSTKFSQEIYQKQKGEKLKNSKFIMQKFWYDYVKPNYGKSTKTVLYGQLH